MAPSTNNLLEYIQIVLFSSPMNQDTVHRVSASTYANYPSVLSPLTSAPQNVLALSSLPVHYCSLGVHPWGIPMMGSQGLVMRDPHDKLILPIFTAIHSVIWHIVIKLSAFSKSYFLSVWDGEGKKIEMFFFKQKDISSHALSSWNGIPLLNLKCNYLFNLFYILIQNP